MNTPLDTSALRKPSPVTLWAMLPSSNFHATVCPALIETVALAAGLKLKSENQTVPSGLEVQD